MDKNMENCETSKKMLDAILSTSPLGICYVRNREIKWISKTLKSMMFYEESEFMDKNTKIFYDDNDEYLWVGENIYSQIKKYGRGQLETKFRRKDGVFVDCIIYGCNIDDNNIEEGQIFCAVDISERKEMENKLIDSYVNITKQQDEISKKNKIIEEEKKNLEKTLDELKRTQKQLLLSEKLASVGKFAAGIAHEINSPLSAAMTGVELIEADFNEISMENLEEKRKDILDSIELIKNGLTKSKDIILKLLENKKHEESRLEEIDIYILVQDVIGFFKNEIIALGIELSCEIVDKDLKINGSYSEFSEAIIKILQNSIDSIRESKKTEKYLKIKVEEKNCKK